MPIICKLLELITLYAKTFSVVLIYALLIISGTAHSASETTVPISAELSTSIAGDLFPVTVKLSAGNLFLTEPVVLFLENGRIGMQARFQAYDHRPAQGVAISEMGRAAISGKIGYNLGTRQILLHDPMIEKLEFDRKNAVTQRFLAQMNEAWSMQITNPIRAELPPHPYLIPFRNNVQDLSYDGKNINLIISYE
jgi:hypothetical protein